MKNKNILKYIIAVFIGWRLALLFVGFLSLSVLPMSTEKGYQFFVHSQNQDYFLKWANWDGGHFRGIAENGYLPFQVVFFPLYPLLIKLLMLTGVDSLWGGLIISHLATLIGLLFLFKLSLLDYSEEKSKQIVFLLLAFPTAFYFGAVYAEGLFLAFSTAALYFARNANLKQNQFTAKKNWIIAFILAGLATVTRLVGVAVIAAVLIELMVPFYKSKDFFKKIDVKKIISVVLLLGLSLIPLGIYMYYLNTTQDNPTAFLVHEERWDRTPTWPWDTLLNYTNFFQDQGLFKISITNQFLVDFLFALILIIGLFYSFSKLRLSYSVYYLLTLIIPLSSGTLSGIHRYGLVIFPFVFLLSQINYQPFIKSWVYFSLTLLGFFTVLFINSYWVT